MIETSAPSPLISIITVVRNAAGSVERTIQSVLAQPFRSLEYIIIDGGSTDGTVEVIKKYVDRLSYWVSEPDKGIYDAMNNALSHVRGRGHLFLNAGDYFVGDVLSDNILIPSHLPVTKTDIFGRVRQVHPKDHRQGLPYCHQGIVFETKGIRFDTSYRFAADYLYYLDHGYTRLPAAPVSGHVYYDNTGLSKINSKVRDREIAEIIRGRFGRSWQMLFLATCGIKDLARPLLSR